MKDKYSNICKKENRRIARETGVFLPFFLEAVFEDFLRADLAGDLDLDLELVDEDEDLFLPLLLISLVTADFFLREEAVGFLRDAELFEIGLGLAVDDELINGRWKDMKEQLMDDKNK